MKTSYPTDEFANRKEAGRMLAERLKKEPWIQSAILLALPRGGVPIGFEVADALGLPLSVLIVRKIGAPKHPEYGIGAVTEEGFFWIDQAAAKLVSANEHYLSEMIEAQNQEIKKRVTLYRHEQPLPDVEGQTVVLIDDGLATGVTARVAARFIKTKHPARLVLALPVCARDTVLDLKSEVDEMICIKTPRPFYAVGQYFKNFNPVSNREVQDLLAKSKGLL